MILERTKEEQQAWKQQIYQYEYNKRTKKPFGKQFKPIPERITNVDMKNNQRQFHPVLQKFQSPHKQTQYKQAEQNKRNLSLISHLRSSPRNHRDFDIINLYGNEISTNKSQLICSANKKDKETVRNIYNPISNKPLPDYLFHGKRVQLPPERNYKYMGSPIKEFDIVKCRYREDSDAKDSCQKQQQDKKIYSKYKKIQQGYNSVFARYNDDKKQQQYEQTMAKSQLIHGADYNKRFPESYTKRQPLMFDHSKPPTSSLAALDQQRINAKQRFKLKYIIEEQYKRRNIQDLQRKQAQMINRVHNSHMLQKKTKQFNNGDAGKYGLNQAQLYLKQATGATWDHLQQAQQYPQSDRYSNRSHKQDTAMSIKSQGFT